MLTSMECLLHYQINPWQPPPLLDPIINHQAALLSLLWDCFNNAWPLKTEAKQNISNHLQHIAFLSHDYIATASSS